MGKLNSLKHNKFSMLSSNPFTNNYHKAVTKQNCPSYLPKPYTLENQVRKKSTQTWNFEVPHVEIRFTTPKMPTFRDLEQKWWPKVGALLELQWRMRGEKKATRERGRELLKFLGLSEERESCFLVLKKLFSFPIILFKLCHMSPFEWSKKGPLFPLDVTHTQSQKGKNLTFATLKKNHASVCVPFLWFPFLAFLCVRRGQFSKVGNIYISKRSEWNPERGSEVGFVKF